MLALVDILSTIHILKVSKNIMNLEAIKKCRKCGKQYRDWSCDYCYSKSVLMTTME